MASAFTYLMIGLILAYAAFAAWIHIGIWQSAPSRQLYKEKATPEQVETTLKALSQVDRAALIAREQQALASNPLDLLAFKNLILLWTIAGETEKSDALILDSAKRSLRDLPLQTAALGSLLKSENYQEAFYRVDALIRSKPERAEEFYDLLMSLAEKESGIIALAETLANNPPWKNSFLTALSARGKQTNTAYRLFSLLRKAGVDIGTAELRPLLARLFLEKAPEKANYVWLDFLSENELIKVGPVFDGGFDLDFRNQYFDWTSDKVQNADLRIVPRATGSTDRVIRLDFAPGRTAFDHFGQYLRLSPGDYVLSGEGKAESLESNSGMVWQIKCLETPDVELVATPPLRGTVAWSPFSAAFTVPAENCATQSLRLRLNAVAVLDQQIQGRVLYDGLKITRAQPAQ